MHNQWKNFQEKNFNSDNKIYSVCNNFWLNQVAKAFIFITHLVRFSKTVYTIKIFSTNVPIMDKSGSWFLLAKCLKNTCGRVTF